MVFSSAPFVFVFLPVLFIVYLATPGFRQKNVVLTIGSLLFYGYGEPLFLLIMIFSIVINYLLAIIMAKYKNFSKPVLVVSVSVNLALIGVFKYAGFAIETVNCLIGSDFHVPEIALPIGISFFTFQIMSYVIDVYRKPETVQKNLGKLMLYVSFFPQLIAGPIVKYHDISSYLDNRSFNLIEVKIGIERFIIGLSKKMLIANVMGAVSDEMFNIPANDLSPGAAWIGALCYTLQIFFDFSGYSDMAIGMGHMFGFTIKENFNYPYISTSIKEFWRRWHISLSTWFKEYLYIPLGGNKKGSLRTGVNKFFVFFVTGLWHGASWNFVIWGMIHGTAITLEGLLDKNGKLDKSRIFGRIYTMFIVVIAFVLFRADTTVQGIEFIGAMFSLNKAGPVAATSLGIVLNPLNIAVFIAALILNCPHKKFKERIFEKSYIISSAGSLLLFALCILAIANDSFNPFIYFRF